MIFKELASYLRKLEDTSSRIEITKILSEIFKNASSEEIDKISYLLLGHLAPKYQGLVFDIAEKMMLRAFSEAYKIESKNVFDLYKKKGDVGVVAEEIAGESGNQGKDPTVIQVYEDLMSIARDEGGGSQERKVNKMAEILSSLDPLSVCFVARIPVGNLRLGFSDKTMLDALSWMEKGDKSAKSSLEKAYQVLPDIGLLAKRVKKEGVEKATEDVTPVIGVPILPMLAQRLNSPTEMIKKMGDVSVEPKLDGLRLSIHFKRGKEGFVKAYTRNLNETSWMFPELVKLADSTRAKELILDCEAVGLDETTKQMADFQSTMTRRRKHEIENTLGKIGIVLYVFDILYKDGKNLMDMPYTKRKEILTETLEEKNNFKVVKGTITKNPEEITGLYHKEIDEGLEGIVVKRADSTYVPGRTGWRWVKMKQTEKTAAKLVDTVDAVVMGYTAGRGKRVDFGLGQFLVGLRDNDQIKSVTKIGTGLTDEQFREMKKRLTKLEVKDKPKEYQVHKDLSPDYWVKPELVVEIAADEITKSPKHTAGLALRFPRLVKFRDDKSAGEATTVGEMEKLYKLQK